MTDTDIVLTPEELAIRWKVSEETLARWRKEGIGPKSFKFGQIAQAGVRYLMADVLAYESPEHG